MIRFLNTTLLVLILLNTSSSFAQTTGSYTTTIPFMGSNRSVAMYVPASYNATNKYRLIICLHGLGDNCVAYRNALINSFSWATNLPNTIFVCPEAANTNADFYSPAGGEGIIQQSIAFAMASYHIDTSNVVLQGFSLGGRAALRYGLDNLAMFKGLLLNTPAVQGVKEALNGHPATYSFNYANAAHIPIYITHGISDFTYTAPIDTAYEQLVLSNGVVHYTEVPGLGHTIPAFSAMSNFLTFFNAPASPGKDVEAVKIYSPAWICNSSQATAHLLFRNIGQDIITTVKYTYTLSGLTQRGTWSGILRPFQYAIVPLSISNSAGGNNLLSVQIDTLNQIFPDTVPGNNQRSSLYTMPGVGVTSLSEGFEGAFPPLGWTTKEAGDFFSAWDVDNTIAKTGAQSAGAFNTILTFDNAGRSEGLITPPIVLAQISKPKLSFDYAYNYHRYTPPYLSAITDFADTLEVLISNDCGEHYSNLYRKGGAALASFANPILNPLNISSCYATPADSNWNQVVIDLSSYPTNGNNVFIKFNYISALGGSINIDNVQVNSAAAVGSAEKAPTYRIYPNPVTDRIFIEGTEPGNIISIFNIMGRQVLSATISSNKQSIALSQLPAGSYLLQIRNKDGQRSSISIIKQQ